VLFLIDASQGVGPGDRYIAKSLRESPRADSTILILNKVDLVRKERLLPVIDSAAQEWRFSEIVPLSALKGDNCDRLLDIIISRLPLGPPLYPADTLTDQSERRLVAELIREKVLVHTRQELPHGCDYLL
jgi:GTP-binding protein Era